MLAEEPDHLIIVLGMYLVNKGYTFGRLVIQTRDNNLYISMGEEVKSCQVEIELDQWAPGP